MNKKQSVTTLNNSSAVIQAFEAIEKKFDVMYAKRAFAHWFVGEGLESGEFSECRETLAQVVQDYKELARSDANPEQDDDY